MQPPLPRIIVLLIGLLFATTLHAQRLPLPPAGESVIGENYLYWSGAGEDLFDIAYTRNLGYEELTAANREVNPLSPGEDTRLNIPTRFILPDAPRSGVVINLAEPRLYFYPRGSSEVITYPLGIGREGWSTPLGQTRITRKTEGPNWYPPESIRRKAEREGNPLPPIVEAGPDNPLGSHALYLGLPSYLIHGTNKERGWGVGRRVSHGCIRLYPEDIASLYHEVPVNTTVLIVDQPYKAGWLDGHLYLEIQPPLIDLEEDPLFQEGRLIESLIDHEINLTKIMRVILNAIGEQNPVIDWEKVLRMAKEQTGIVERITVFE